MSPPDGQPPTAIVTGAARGLGRAIAARLVAGGYTVVIADVDAEAASRTAARLSDSGTGPDSGSGDAVGIETDVTDPDAVDRVVSETLDRFGGIDALVNNAGIFQSADPAVDQDTEEWQRVIDVHLKGTYLASTAVGASMVERGAGSIVNISSVAGLGAFPRRTAYGPAKAAINNLTEVLAVEWADSGVSVNAVAPGYVDKSADGDHREGGDFDAAAVEERTPAGRLIDPGTVAETVLFLAEREGAELTGAVIPVDGGWTAYNHF